MTTDRPVAIVTGAGRNIGRAICLALGARGFDVAVNTRSNHDEAGEVVERLAEMGSAGVPVVVDVAAPDGGRRLVDATLERFGRCDAVVNNAALRYHGKAFTELSESEWREVFATNLDAAFHICQAVLPGMVERGSGSIVNLSGSVAFEGADTGAHVAASKAAVVGLTRALAREYAPFGIRVNAVVPAVIDTVRAEPLPDALVRSSAERTPMGRLGRPDEVGAVCAFLASADSGYVTGQSLHVNGGLIMS